MRSSRPGSSVLVDAVELGRSGQVPVRIQHRQPASPIRRSSAACAGESRSRTSRRTVSTCPGAASTTVSHPAAVSRALVARPSGTRNSLDQAALAPPHRRVRSGRPQLTFNDAYSPHSDSCGKLPFVRLVAATPVTLTCHTDIRRIVDDTRCDSRALAGRSDRAAVIGLPWVTPNGRRRPFRKRGRRRLRKGRSGRYRVGLVRAVVAQLLDVAVGSALVADARRSCPSLGILN